MRICSNILLSEGSIHTDLSTSLSITVCSAFTPPPTSDVMSPGLVEDGIKCGSGRMCCEQRCVSISSLGLPQCPTGSNGRVCSGNGVRPFLDEHITEMLLQNYVLEAP